MLMAIPLTEEQRKALEARPGGPIEVVDPATNRVYVLVTAEAYQRVRNLLEQAVPGEPRARVAPLMLRSQQAYWRDLPKLRRLRSKQRQWVAYHGDEQIGFGATDIETYQACFRRGLRRGDFYVGTLEGDPDGVPPWGTLTADRSLYEFTEGERHDVPPPAS